MHISRVQIKNFRNFACLDVKLGEHAVVVGENRIGKSNFLYALRLILDPSLPDSARTLREEDFWDGLKRPLGENDRIVISVDLTDFEDNENLLAILAEHVVQPEPMVARITYVWQAQSGIEGPPKKDSDYEFLIFGGDRPANRITYEVRRSLPLEVIPALRDCEGDLARWTRSPLRPLLEKAAEGVDRAELKMLADDVDRATGKLAEIEGVMAIGEAIKNKLLEMVGSAQSLETILRFSPSEPDKMIRALRLFIDGGRRSISDASLGSANLLYFALKNLEYKQLVEEGNRDHTFLAIEEPEAHLHPTLQRLIFRNYLVLRDNEEEDRKQVSTILMTTHSPHIASVTPLKDIVVLRSNRNGNATEGVSTVDIKLPEEEVADLERYIDVNRAELLFARGVILVEGDAERFLLPILAKRQGKDLNELGISVCSISGTNFAPYLTLVGPKGLDLPFAALTDFDPLRPKEDGTLRKPLGPDRVVNGMMTALTDDETWETNDFTALLNMAPQFGIFLNSHTFEVDLFNSGLEKEFVETMDDVGINDNMKTRMRALATNPSVLKKPVSADVDRFLADIGTIGKGRFAQRLASVIAKSGTQVCPDYIKAGVEHVANQCKRS